MEARKERLLGVWCRKLQAELLLINAPVLVWLYRGAWTQTGPRSC